MLPQEFCTEPPGFDVRDEATRGDNIVSGDTADQSSYCSELSGLYGVRMVWSITSVVYALCVYKIDQGAIDVEWDGITVLERCFDETQNPTIAAQHFDLILTIRNIRAHCPIHWKHRHVEGHQDDNSSGFLDRWALLNIDIDLTAKVHWHRHTGRQPRPVWKIHGEPSSLWIVPRKLCRNLVSPRRSVWIAALAAATAAKNTIANLACGGKAHG
jgi:hypothetical protein